MTKREFLAACCGATILMVTAGSAVGRPAQPVMAARAGLRDASESTNWAGYSASQPGVSFEDVKGSWVQPAVDCTLSGPSTSSFWVGLGGLDSSTNALEQTGTAADCLPGGRAIYYAWYEVIPAPATQIPVAVSPGDTIAGEVSANGTAITLQLQNLTTGQTSTTQQTVDAPDLGSAEWIAEAPSSCTSADPNACIIQPLASFGTVAFSGSSATAAGHTGPIADPTWAADLVQLVATSGEPVAQTSSLATDGASFTVTWQSTGRKLALHPLAFATTPLRPRAGRRFTVSLGVTTPIPAALAEVKTVCAARIGGKPVAAAAHSFKGGAASCTWQIPATASGKTIAGSVTATARGAKLTRPFSYRIR